MKKIVIDPAELEPRQNHRLLLSIVIPRPIALISTISQDGIHNLAPYSHYQLISANPPAVLFCPTRDRNANIKHSLANARQTGEFVVSAVTEDMAEMMNLASAEFPEGVSEFAKVGYTPLKAELVKVPLVAESPINLECKVFQIVELSAKPLAGAVVIGEVVRVHVNENLLDRDNLVVKLDRYHPISRLGGVAYAPIREVFDMPRPKMTPEGEVVPDSHLKAKK